MTIIPRANGNTYLHIYKYMYVLPCAPGITVINTIDIFISSWMIECLPTCYEITGPNYIIYE